MLQILSLLKNKIFVFLVCICLLTLCSSCITARPLTWIEDSFEDFNDGEFDASGADLYVTAKGTIKTINRFDLNGPKGSIDEGMIMMSANGAFAHNDKLIAYYSASTNTHGNSSNEYYTKYE
jgi:hypothetical protein